MEIKSVINNGGEVVRLYWLDLLRKDWTISKVSKKGKIGVPLTPQKWIEYFYRIEGAIEYFDETISNKSRK